MKQGNFLTYLYCLCEERPTLPAISLNHQKEIISFNEFFAVTETISSQDFGEKSLQNNINEMEWLVPKVHIHEGVIQQLMSQTTVLPVKFATIFSGKKSLQTSLEKNKAKYRANFSKLRNRQEWGVKVFSTKETHWLFQHTEDEEILTMQDAITSASPGKAFLMKKKLNTLVQTKKNGLYKAFTSKLYQDIKLNTVESKQKSVLPTQRSDENMMLNAVFLLENNEVPNWIEQIKNIEEEINNESLVINVSGPWPPYHFMN